MKTKVLNYNVLTENGRIYTGGEIPKYVPVYNRELRDINDECTEENKSFIIGFAKLTEEVDGVTAKFFLNGVLGEEPTFKPFGTGTINDKNMVIDYKLLGLYIA